ncbi:MAG: LysM peptidoglycan-binding domain-containing protein [Anaerolineae bacterium]|nr:LysM peptidoglycan-binding domain-containing protein [Anaerolineae bacterium]
MQDKPLFTTLLAAAILILLVLLPFPQPAVMAQSTPPSPYNLIAAINNLRNANGLPALQINNALMSAAQLHSQYQASIGSWSHTGSGGSSETDRALAAGYGSGDSVICDEAVAVAQAATTVDYIVNVIWNDYQHRNLVLLNSRFSDIGAGAAIGSDGLVYYTVDHCTTGGSQTVASPAATAVTRGSAAPSPSAEVIKTVVAATPLENGSIVHIVEAGQTLWSIATAYGQTTDQLAALNGLPTPNPVIYVGQKLLVRPAFTPTLTPTITITPRPATRTPRPTFTPQPTRPTRTATLEPTPTSQPLVTLPKFDRRWFGISLVAICGLGLVTVLANHLLRSKPGAKEPPKDPTKEP